MPPPMDGDFLMLTYVSSDWDHPKNKMSPTSD